MGGAYLGRRESASHARLQLNSEQSNAAQASLSPYEQELRDRILQCVLVFLSAVDSDHFSHAVWLWISAQTTRRHLTLERDHVKATLDKFDQEHQEARRRAEAKTI